jgi:hypothetical protein
MIARLVEQRVMGFDDTLAHSFPAFAKTPERSPCPGIDYLA